MLTKTIVEQAFKPLITGEGSFLDHLADDVHWTVTGNDYPLAGTYTSKSDVSSKVFAPIYAKIHGGLATKIVNVLVSGEWAVVEFTADGHTKSGEVYKEDLCWVCRFSEERIVQVREYLDSARVKRLLEE